MASAAELLTLDAIGPVLCRLGHERVNLSWSRDAQGSGYYFVDGKDAEGRFFSGMGDTPSQALAAAEREANSRALGGIYINA